MTILAPSRGREQLTQLTPWSLPSGHSQMDGRIGLSFNSFLELSLIGSPQIDGGIDLFLIGTPQVDGGISYPRLVEVRVNPDT